MEKEPVAESGGVERAGGADISQLLSEMRYINYSMTHIYSLACAATINSRKRRRLDILIYYIRISNVNHSVSF
jgi:hypothetical protein